MRRRDINSGTKVRWDFTLFFLSLYRSITTACLSATILFTSLLSTLALTESAVAQERFKNVEIRVIRPKFFNKRKRFELGVHGSLIMNETFIYTLLASGMATYHFTETLAISATASIGYSIDKDDKSLLLMSLRSRPKFFGQRMYLKVKYNGPLFTENGNFHQESLYILIPISP